MQAPPLQARLNAATGMFAGPVSVVLALFAQSTWNFQRFSEFDPKFMMKLGDPAGGALLPSRSDGRRPPKLDPSWKHCCVAAAPDNIALRFRAQTFEPANELPFVKML